MGGVIVVCRTRLIESFRYLGTNLPNRAANSLHLTCRREIVVQSCEGIRPLTAQTAAILSAPMSFQHVNRIQGDAYQDLHRY
jgi:hypothetical protein